MSYNPWGCKRVRHDLATKQQQEDKNHPINVQEIPDKHSLDRFFFFFFEQKEVENISISLPRLLERKNEGNIKKPRSFEANVKESFETGDLKHAC